jgi:hypothetical protein
MKPGPWILIGVVVAMMAACQPLSVLPAESSATPLTDNRNREPQALASGFFAALLSKDYTTAEADFDASLRRQFGPDRLARTWQAMLDQSGAYQSRDSNETQIQPPYSTYLSTLHFAHSAFEMRVVIDMETRQITGLFFSPSSQVVPTAEYDAPLYVDRSRFIEREVTVGAAPWALSGTLSLPMGNGPFPVVVLIHGSGPNDRDETIGAVKPFRDIAWGLATTGIAVLRYDKRSYVYPASESTLSSAGFTVKDETLDDAHAAIALLRSTREVDVRRIFVLGHSLGGMLAPRIAQADSDLAGLIIMAGPTRPLEDLIVEQTIYQLSLHGAQTSEDNTRLENVKREASAIKALTPDDAALTTSSFLGAPPSYWLDLRSYHPAEVARGLKQRMLILWGSRDYQVTWDDLSGWKAALISRANIEISVFTDLNHLFVTGKGKSTPEEYQQPGHVDPQVISALVAWVRKS